MLHRDGRKLVSVFHGQLPISRVLYHLLSMAPIFQEPHSAFLRIILHPADIHVVTGQGQCKSVVVRPQFF